MSKDDSESDSMYGSYSDGDGDGGDYSGSRSRSDSGSNDSQFDRIIKLIVIGDSGVGKTNILERFVINKFTLESKTTIGVAF